MPKSLFKPMVKAKPKKAGINYAALSFARQGEMITEEEYQACFKGDMVLNSTELTNLNARSHIPTGGTVRLYVGRGLKLQSDMWLGETISEQWFVRSP
ncbi:MAG: hypothetical protein ACT4OK_11150 [Gemmobacter sp.]